MYTRPWCRLMANNPIKTRVCISRVVNFDRSGNPHQSTRFFPVKVSGRCSSPNRMDTEATKGINLVAASGNVHVTCGYTYYATNISNPAPKHAPTIACSCIDSLISYRFSCVCVCVVLQYVLIGSTISTARIDEIYP